MIFLLKGPFGGLFSSLFDILQKLEKFLAFCYCLGMSEQYQQPTFLSFWLSLSLSISSFFGFIFFFLSYFRSILLLFSFSKAFLSYHSVSFIAFNFPLYVFLLIISAYIIISLLLLFL